MFYFEICLVLCKNNLSCLGKSTIYAKNDVIISQIKTIIQV